MSCYNTEVFLLLEEKLYDNKPELKQKNLIFLCNGNVVNTALTLEQNKIKDKSTILITEQEDI